MLLDGVFQGFENETDAQENNLAPEHRQIEKNRVQLVSNEKRKSR